MWQERYKDIILKCESHIFNQELATKYNFDVISVHHIGWSLVGPSSIARDFLPKDYWSFPDHLLVVGGKYKRCFVMSMHGFLKSELPDFPVRYPISLLTSSIQ